MDDLDWIIIYKLRQNKKKLLDAKRKSIKKRSMWKRELFLNREQDGEYFRIKDVLRNDPEKFQRYYRMSIESFDMLLDKIEMLPVYCSAVCKEECLTITLRYYAVGSNFSAMSFNFRLAHNTIGKIVKKTSIAIWEALAKEYICLSQTQPYGKIWLRTCLITVNFPIAWGL